MIDIRTGKHFTEPSARSQMTRGEFLRGGIASIIAAKSAPYIAVSSAVLAGSANASVGRGMMRNVGARNAAMFEGDGVNYCNYIQTNGSCAIDTRIIPSSVNIRIESVFSLPKQTNSVMIGCGNSIYFGWVVPNYGYRLYFRDGIGEIYPTRNDIPFANTLSSIVFDRNSTGVISAYVDGIKVNSADSIITETTTIGLFRSFGNYKSSGGDDWYVPDGSKMKSCKITQDGIVCFNGHAAIIDGEGALYDSVTKTYFKSVTSSKFTYE